MMSTNLWIALAAMLTFALVIIWWPYFRNTKLQASEVNNRSQANTESYQQSLAKLQRQLDDQQLSQQEFDALNTELARKLIQDEASQEQQLVVGKRTVVWPILVSLFTIGLSVSMYLSIGSSEQVIAASLPQTQNTSSQAQQMALAIAKMEQEVTDDPKNTQLLFQLAHTYLSIAKFDQAISAFNELIQKEGQHAEFIGPLAQAMYYKNQQKMTPAIEALTKQALAIDPQNSATLILLGMDSFGTSKYAQAITYWQRVLINNQPGVDIVAIEGAIEEAKSRLSLTGETMPQAPIAVATASLTVNVEFSDALSANPQQIVFIYAIPAQGPRMPLAAIKLTVAELPKQVTLDDSMAMTPAAKLSDHQTVKLFAVVSQSGSAGIKPGDLRGLIESANTRAGQPYTLVIDTVVE